MFETFQSIIFMICTWCDFKLSVRQVQINKECNLISIFSFCFRGTRSCTCKLIKEWHRILHNIIQCRTQLIYTNKYSMFFFCFCRLRAFIVLSPIKQLCIFASLSICQFLSISLAHMNSYLTTIV